MLLCTLLIGSCNKKPEIAPETTIAEQENEETAIPIIQKRNFSGETTGTTARCRDGNILAIMGNQNAFLRKISATDGSIIWEADIKGSGGGYTTDIKEMPGGNIWIVNAGTLANAVVTCFSSSGAKLWRKEYQPLDFSIILPQDENKAFIVSFDTKLRILALNHTGDTLISKTHTLNPYTSCDDAIITGNGTILIAGTEGGTWGDVRFIMLDNDLNIVTDRKIESGTNRKMRRCVQTRKGDILCVGEQNFSPHQQSYVLRLDQSLNLLQTDVYGNDTAGISLYCITETASGYAAGGNMHTSSMAPGGLLGGPFVVTSNRPGNEKQQRAFLAEGCREYIWDIWSTGTGCLLLGSGHTDNGGYNSFVMGLDKKLQGQQ